ncbi:hypothetical protein [Streptomyces sp. ME19-01-6]|uniref:hypothetical protein n=1 Tax=Streptomyces sp. ME19-01-6 TaxID=3028686 RepID=UPI0029A87723|nr:hypothetical protein [Streptomyces sp. ME19-01-6]MDX3228915.1 hypothetical protein [Streptomyces sp. ME19-01-6]
MPAGDGPLWRPEQELSKVDITTSMIRLLAACHHRRRIHVVADAAYHGKALRDLPATCTFTTRLPASSVLFALAPPPTGKRGRPALKGTRLGTPAQLAAAADFTPVRVTRYQRTDTVHLAEVTCLWYDSFHTRTVRVILLRDDTTDTGYDLALVTTDLTSSPAELITDTRCAGPSRSPSPRPATCSAPARPTTAPAPPSSAPCPPGCTATRSPWPGTRCTATSPATWPSTASAHPGTPPRPTPRCPTWSPSSAG